MNDERQAFFIIHRSSSRVHRPAFIIYQRGEVEMKLKRRFLPAAALALVALSAVAHAQLRAPRPSQKATVMQTVGVTDITITYSRPGVKGRTIWGDPPAAAVTGTATLDDARARAANAVIVPYGHVWRAGANEATQFVVTDDVLVNGQPLKAGTYSLHMIPGKDEWTVIFNSDAGQWGSFTYDEKKDVLRVKAKPQPASDTQEWLMYTFDPVTENSAQVNLRWERLRVPFTVEVKDVKGLAIEKMRAAVASAKPDDWRTPLQAANYVFTNNLTANSEEAMQWLDKSIKTKETFNNLYTKARVLAGTGKTADAVAAAEKALQMAKAPNSGVDAPTIADLEKRMAEWKSKM
jgi:methionine-rich copper-binding protein CopC